MQNQEIKNEIPRPKALGYPVRRYKNFSSGASIVISVACLLMGCTQKRSSSRAQEYARNSQEFYQQAVGEYKKLIKSGQGQDSQEFYFALGKLYYDHGDFVQAQDSFRKSKLAQAKKFLAIAEFRLGNFTDALDAFNKNEISDDEYRYYHGLTCEKLNLFDQALKIYRQIKDPAFFRLAQAEIDLIEKQTHLVKIEELDQAVAKIIAAAPSQEAWPQAGALVLYCDESIETNPDYTQVSTLHYLVKILNERGKEEFSESKIEYDSTDEKVELLYARTIKPDGTVAEVSRRNIRDVSKYLNFPLYSNARVFIISFPEIAEGSVVEYKAKIYHSQLVNKKDFVVSYPLQAQEPILDARFTVSLPQGEPLHIKTINEAYNNFSASFTPQIQKEGGYRIYLWQFKNIPQIIPEPNMPPDVKINPSILLSTFASWQDIYHWWWPLAKDKIKADRAIEIKVKELLKGKKSAPERIRAIYNFCCQNIRYVAVEYGQAGYEPHSAADIFKNKYGDCKDQAILLVTMLKQAGFTAWPVLIPTRDQYDLIPDFPSLPFDHCIAAVLDGGEKVFLDPTAQTCAFGDLPAGDQERQVLLVKDDGYEIIATPLYQAGHNLIKEKMELRISRDESIKAKKDIYAYGMYDQGQRYWLLYTPPQLIGETLKEKIQGVSIGARLDNYEIKNLADLNSPVELSYAFSGPEYFTNAGSLRILPQLAELDVTLSAKEKRHYPLDLGILEGKERVFTIEIPDNFRVTYLPAEIKKENPWLKFHVEYSLQGKKLVFQQKQELKEKIISQTDYPHFKAKLEELAKEIKQRVILEKVH